MRDGQRDLAGRPDGSGARRACTAQRGELGEAPAARRDCLSTPTAAHVGASSTHGGERWLYCKGAPEAVLPLCAQIEHGGGAMCRSTTASNARSAGGAGGDGRWRAARAGLRLSQAGAATRCRAEQALTLSRPDRARGPAAPRGARGDRALPCGRHQGHHGHRRPSANGARHRPRDRPGERCEPAVVCSATHCAGCRRRSCSSRSTPGNPLRPRHGRAEDADRAGAARARAKSSPSPVTG